MRGVLGLIVVAALVMPQPLVSREVDKPSATRSVLTWTPVEQARWYKAMEEVLPARVVRRGGTVRALPAGDRTIEPRWTEGGKAMTVDSWMAAYRVSGVLVMRDGKILLERYGLGRAPEERWTSFSVSKSVTALLAGAAIRDGKLKLDDLVVQYMPELKGSAYDGVTVRQMLTMSSGVRWREGYVGGESDLAKMGVLDDQGGDIVTGYLAKLPRAHAPGEQWHYNTAETHLLGMMIARATGVTLSDYLSKKIWTPYGMEQDAVWLLDAKGREAAGCCLSATLRDFARIGQFALDGGTVDGKPVMPDGFIADATSVRIANDQPAPSGYGYQWWIGARAYEASGIFGQSILVYPKERIVIVVNSAWPIPQSKALFGALSLFQGAAHDAAAPDFSPTMRP